MSPARGEMQRSWTSTPQLLVEYIVAGYIQKRHWCCRAAATAPAVVVVVVAAVVSC